jgi:hypothetical protein
MGLNLGTIMKVASVASTIGSHIDLSDVTSGFNLSNISPSSMPSVADTIVGKLTSKSDSIVSGLTGIKLDNLDPESITSSMNIDSKVDQMMSDIESKAQAAATSSNPSDYESLINGMDMEGQINNMMNDTLSGMGLDSINYM